MFTCPHHQIGSTIMDGFRLENMWSNIGVKVVNDFNSSSTIVE
jgi:hypothetical protein